MNTFHIQLILPNIRSCHNVGAMFRTADAMDVQKLYLVGYTAAPPKPQIDKVSLGAETWVPWEKCDDLPVLIEKLKQDDVEIIALEKNEQSQSLADFVPTKNMALIVGNEVDGLSNDILEMCDTVLHIPMLGKKESLNVSVAAGIALHHLRHTNV